MLLWAWSQASLSLGLSKGEAKGEDLFLEHPQHPPPLARALPCSPPGQQSSERARQACCEGTPGPARQNPSLCPQHKARRLDPLSHFASPGCAPLPQARFCYWVLRAVIKLETPNSEGGDALQEQRRRPAFMLPKPEALSVAPTSRALRASAHTLPTPPERCEGRTSILGSRVQPATPSRQPWPGTPVLGYATLTLCFVFIQGVCQYLRSLAEDTRLCWLPERHSPSKQKAVSSATQNHILILGSPFPSGARELDGPHGLQG